VDLNYRSILILELERRKKVNPSYSLRAYARDLGIAAPQLSSVIKGTKGISPESAKNLAKKLDLSEEEAEVFQHSALALHSREKSKREKSQDVLNKLIEGKKFQTLKEPSFSLINEWFYLSLLQMFELKDFKPNSSWMSDRLGITKQEVDTALVVLEKTKLLKKIDGFYKPTQEFIKTEDIPSRTIRFHLQQMLNKASKALDTQSIDERDFSSTVFSIDAKQIGEFKKKLRAFREQFCQDASLTRNKTEIYNLSIQFFRVTKLKP
jgi:uncharacterized protein (TIGR02147 family)